jgi:hypothetical protein
VAGLLAAAAVSACKAPPELRPDQLLQDSLELTDRDRVHTVRLLSRVGVDTPDPVDIVVRDGDFVNLVIADRRARTVRFDTAGLTVDARAWAEGAGLFRAPFLADLDARWVLDFEDAPAGRYGYRVIGGGEEGLGVIIVEAR